MFTCSPRKENLEDFKELMMVCDNEKGCHLYALKNSWLLLKAITNLPKSLKRSFPHLDYPCPPCHGTARKG
jgi:hypothetical protein